MGIYEKIDWEAWVYGPGLAPVQQDFTTKGLNDSLALVASYIDGTVDHAQATKDWNTEFKSTTKTIFAQKLNTEFKTCGLTCMNSTTFLAIDADMNITGEINPDVKQEWQPLGIMLGEKVTVDGAHWVAQNVGRMKYLSPIY